MSSRVSIIAIPQRDPLLPISGESWYWIQNSLDSSYLRLPGPFSEAAGSLFYGPDIAADPDFGETLLRYLTFSSYGPNMYGRLSAGSYWHAERPELSWQTRAPDWRFAKQKKGKQKQDGIDHSDVFSYMETLPTDQRGDPVYLAIMLTIAATHTTATLLTTIIYQICKHWIWLSLFGKRFAQWSKSMHRLKQVSRNYVL